MQNHGPCLVLKAVTASYLEHFDRFSSNFELKLIWERGVLELHLAKFCRIATELWCSKLHFAQYILNK